MAKNPKLQEEFLKAYDAYADAIFRHCAYRLVDRERGKDVMQETFIRAWEYVEGGESVQNMRAFLYRIANNLIVDYARKRKEQSLDQMYEATGFEPGEDTRDMLHTRIDIQNVMKTMKKLDEAHREVLVMRYVDDLSPAEIAELLGLSANVVSVRLHRAVKQLKSLLRHDG